MTNSQKFDAFLAHNSKNKSQVRDIANQLKQYDQNLKLWLDEEQIRAGDGLYLKVMEGIVSSRSAIFFIGLEGSGKWQGDLELPTIITSLYLSGNRVIPVLLPGVKEMPKIVEYAFLATRAYVLFENISDRKSLIELYKGVTNQEYEEADKQKSEKFQQQLQVQILEDEGVKNPVASIDKSDDLISEKGIDYTRLKSLLAGKQWRDSDIETKNIMLKIANREIEGMLTTIDMENFPYQDLRIIEQLWSKYSYGHFGFSVQKKIWERVGEIAKDNKYQLMGTMVGWYSNGKWIHPTNLKFSLDAPFGHLPALAGWACCITEDGKYIVRESLFERMDVCGL